VNLIWLLDGKIAVFRHYLVAIALAMLVAGVFAVASQGKQATETSSAALPPIEDPQPQALPIKPASLTDLAWLQGQWTGAWGPRTAVQVWSAPRAGVILGTLQIIAEDKTTVIEFFTISQTLTGAEYRILHFTPSLAPWETSGPSTLFLMSSDSRKFVFQNPTDGKPQQIVLVKNDPDTYIFRSEILPETGDPLTYDITFHRQKPSAGNASHQ
jgi:hypothetical protein